MNPPTIEFVKDALRVARAATKGPWTARCRDIGCEDTNFDWNAWDHSGLGWEIYDGDGNELEEPMRGMLNKGCDAAHITKFDPPTVIALMEDWLRLREIAGDMYACLIANENRLGPLTRGKLKELLPKARAALVKQG